MGSDSHLPELPPPLTASEFLDWMTTDWPGLYLLGALNRQITVHSQQRRAVNLIQALISERGGLDGKSVAIVGAGFSGLTAAAFALEKTTARVTLFDSAPRPLWIQDTCLNRSLHPGIYDWPFYGSLEPSTALPVLNWHAGTARDVAHQVRAQWDHIVSTNSLLQMKLETEITGVDFNEAETKLFLELRSGSRLPFDVVIMAIGFGIESGGMGHVGYWNDADGLDHIEKGASVLISGYGDGGLADLLRLCLPDFGQDNLVELVRHVPARTCRQLIDMEKEFQGNGEKLDQFYEDLAVEPIVKKFAESTEPIARVTLTGRGNLYGTGSAILNRFLVSQLRKARGDEGFRRADPMVPGSLRELGDGRYRVSFGNNHGPEEFRHVVFRWGPDPAYRHVRYFAQWNAGDERRRHWRDMPQALDRTRLLLRDLSQKRPDDSLGQDLLAYESSLRRWCLILQPSPNPQVNWAVHVQLALEASRKRTRLNTLPIVRFAADCFVSDAALRSTVRALCTADIVIADVTDYDPSVMVLLGIRASVRRSITIACTSEAITPDFWQEVPFNLRELNLVSFSNGDEGLAALKETLTAGLTQSSIATRYLDLPVYDYIREEPSADLERDPEQVLLLRAFKHYDSARKNLVQERISEALQLGAESRVESVIDQRSPRLAGQRLYEAIRHWRRCVVDLTWWRPNVMFELGVRLASRQAEMFRLHDESADGSGNQDAVKNLRAFLAPVPYDLSTSSLSAGFKKQWMSGGVVYETVVRHFRTVQDHYDQSVESVLTSVAAVVKGDKDPLQDVDLRPLYAEQNPVYGQRIRNSAVEMLCAAWYYLAEREQLHLLRPLDLLDNSCLEDFRRFRELGAKLKTSLALRPQGRDERLRQRIADTETAASISGAIRMEELLSSWRKLRASPPWSTSLNIKDLDGAIEDAEYDLQQLSELETLLETFASPACQLPLEGVRSDKKRVELAIAKFHRRRGD